MTKRQHILNIYTIILLRILSIFKYGVYSLITAKFVLNITSTFTTKFIHIFFISETNFINILLYYYIQVAVKVLEKSRIKDKKDVERISREIKILKQLHHPNVV